MGSTFRQVVCFEFQTSHTPQFLGGLFQICKYEESNLMTDFKIWKVIDKHLVQVWPKEKTSTPEENVTRWNCDSCITGPVDYKVLEGDSCCLMGCMDCLKQSDAIARIRVGDAAVDMLKKLMMQ